MRLGRETKWDDARSEVNWAMHAIWIVHSCIRWRWTTVVAFVCNEWKWKNSRLEFEITTNIRSLFFYAKQFVPFFSSRGGEGINVVHTFSCMRVCVFHMWILANFMAFCCWFVISIAWLSIFSSMWFNTFWNRFFFIFYNIPSHDCILFAWMCEGGI